MPNTVPSFVILVTNPASPSLRRSSRMRRSTTRELSSLIRKRYPQRATAEKSPDPKKLLEDMLARRNEGRTQAEDGLETRSTE